MGFLSSGIDGPRQRYSPNYQHPFNPPSPKKIFLPWRESYGTFTGTLRWLWKLLLVSGNSDDLMTPYLATGIGQLIQARGPWLFLLFFGGMFTGNVLQIFEGDLKDNIELSFFIPLLIGTGGNTGSQTVATVIRALAMQDVRPYGKDVVRMVLRETLTGLAVGVALGGMGFVLAISWSMRLRVAMAVACSVPLITFCSNLIGALVPVAACRAGVDPAVISAPVCTTITDALGLVIFFVTAKIIL